jgi:dipeptidyl aminopeptidase/acylaminoacyl peptidase
MRRCSLRLALVAASLALAGPGPGAAEKVAPPPDPTGQARFTNHARFVDAQLSPKGTWLAVVSVEGGKRSLSFIRLADRKMTGRLAPGGTAMVGQFDWANDERVVTGLLEVNGTLARPVNYGELLAVNPDGATHELIFGWRAGRPQVGTNIKQAGSEWAWGEMVDSLRHDRRRILVRIGRFDAVGDSRIRLAKVDVYSGARTEVTESPVPNSIYLTDEEGEPRIAWSTGADAQPQILFRDEKRGWLPTASLPGLTTRSRPWHYRASDRSLEVVEPGEGGFGLFSVSIDSGERKVVATTRLSTPSRILRDRETGRILAVESQPDLPDWQLLEPEHPLVQVLAGLLDAHPGLHVDLVSQTEDQRLAIAHVYGDRDPGRFLLVDVAKRSAEPLLENRPWIKPEQMAEMTAFHIKASDGQPIHGYVTYPPGLPAGVKPPLVVLPHGGPFGVRDRWGFNPEVQLLASEGFAVLQVNFRGSGGYGVAYQEAGYRHWGDRMVEDVLDATRWLVKKEKVDGSRMCTYGGSFGGYAALQAVSLAPGLFRCAVGFAGVYDLTRLEHNDDMVDSGRARGYVSTTVGDDQAALKAASPVFHADLIKVPVLLIHGGKDKRVPIVHAEKLRDALTALGRPPEWLEEPLEGHGFYDEAARARQYARLVEFLKRHTAPRP